MDSHDLLLAIIVGGALLIIMRRLHRLGAQIEALYYSVMIEVVRDGERRHDLQQAWRAKPKRY